jgi:hypothetical protein
MKRTSLAILALIISISTLAQNGGDLDSKFYFRFAYSQPASSYIGVDDDAFWDEFSRVGAAFELGNLFMLNSIDLSDGLRLGINVDFAEFSYQQLTRSEALSDFHISVAKVSSKVGPSLSYSPVPGLVFDVTVKAKIPWVGGLVLWTPDDVEEWFLAKPTVGLATGLNIRYRFLMFGFEYNSERMKFESQDFPGTYFGNLSDDSDKTPMPSFSFSLGFCF